LAGFQQGFTVCVRQEPQWTLALSFAVPFGFQIDLNAPYDLRARLRLVTLATLHGLVRHVMPVVVNQSLPKISGREISCLKWAARGKTASEISTLIGVSEATVVFHLNNLMKKLRVNNRTQAIAVGISMGLAT
jgi:DNA-binding CsgD family transcriptional regulator